MIVKLPCCVYTEEATDQLAIDENAKILHLCSIRDVSFLQISYFGSYVEDEVEYTEISSGGVIFYCTLPPEEVEKRILMFNAIVL